MTALASDQALVCGMMAQIENRVLDVRTIIRYMQHLEQRCKKVSLRCVGTLSSTDIAFKHPESCSPSMHRCLVILAMPSCICCVCYRRCRGGKTGELPMPILEPTSGQPLEFDRNAWEQQWATQASLHEFLTVPFSCSAATGATIPLSMATILKKPWTFLIIPSNASKCRRRAGNQHEFLC